MGFTTVYKTTSQLITGGPTDSRAFPAGHPRPSAERSALEMDFGVLSIGPYRSPFIHEMG